MKNPQKMKNQLKQFNDIITVAAKKAIQEKMDEMISNNTLFKEGDRVCFDGALFASAKDPQTFSPEYVEFVMQSLEQNTVYTVSYDEEYTTPPVLLVTFKEDKKPAGAKWLNYVGYLVYAEEHYEDN